MRKSYPDKKDIPEFGFHSDLREMKNSYDHWLGILTVDTAAEQYKKTLELKKALRVPYRCSHCGHKESQWSGRCPECDNWGTFALGLDSGK